MLNVALASILFLGSIYIGGTVFAVLAGINLLAATVNLVVGGDD